MIQQEAKKVNSKIHIGNKSLAGLPQEFLIGNYLYIHKTYIWHGLLHIASGKPAYAHCLNMNYFIKITEMDEIPMAYHYDFSYEKSSYHSHFECLVLENEIGCTAQNSLRCCSSSPTTHFKHGNPPTLKDIKNDHFYHRRSNHWRSFPDRSGLCQPHER